MSDRRQFFEDLVYHATDLRRYTQQSPVMPDVWIEYGLNPGRQLDVLMVPNWRDTSADLAKAIKVQLQADKQEESLRQYRDPNQEARPPQVAYNQNVVVAKLWFDQLVRAVLPLSRWWLRSVSGVHGPDDKDRLHEALKHPSKLVSDIAAAMNDPDPEKRLASDAAWLARVAGLIAFLSTSPGREEFTQAEPSESEQVRRLRQMAARHEILAKALVDLMKGIEPVEWDDPFPLYSVNRNRETSASLYDSVPAVKADAARRLFQVRGKGIRWAVVDSGIDAEHIAFRRRDAIGFPALSAFEKREPRRRRRAKSLPPYRNETRIIATYDFVNVRELLGASEDEVDDLDREKFPALRDAKLRDELKKLLGEMDSHMIDWERWIPFLEIPHQPGNAADGYRPPKNRHGTHVAGIIGADWRTTDGRNRDGEEVDIPTPPEHDNRDLVGIAPEIELYDLRVLDERGIGNEFAIMSALQFIRDLNNHKDFVAVHGVNLSFSIPHDVANYACGRTPVCEEAERLVASGVVVVAAAGNSGRARYMTPTGLPDDGFRTVSITDPGNAEGVITVGATHRSDAHTYGVSYFSSRGPTGDGRLKPDLVAPGEKIRSTIPGNSEDRLDGTSMAAPHVSGAAALILARHPEFINQPKRVKEILCQTATDLGRERYFQGAGLLDILRALQSV